MYIHIIFFHILSSLIYVDKCIFIPLTNLIKTD